MNNQSPEKKQKPDETILQVHSIFYTIQGEGPFTGDAAVFIRLAGCNLQCPSCDTDYTSNRHETTPLLLFKSVRDIRPPDTLVVITGGEPFRQNIYPLVKTLLDNGYTVQIETNGTLPPSDPRFAELCSLNTSERNKCFIVCSPKTSKINPVLRELVCAFKYVMGYDSISDDGLPKQALGNPAKPYVARRDFSSPALIYLQPRDDNNPIVNKWNLEECVSSVMKHGYTLQLQIHKIINME